MKKRAQNRGYLGLGFRVILCLAFLVLFRALLRMHCGKVDDFNVGSDWNNATSDDGFLSNGSKIAFLFLARSNLPLDFVWDAFFKNAEPDKFSVYIHSEPGYVFDESTTKSPFFYNRQLKTGLKVTWGGSTMIEAERLLLRSALADPTNQRFVLLSDSCVPLYNFTYIYNYLMASRKSFVDIFLDKKQGRYNLHMAPTIPKEKWRKGSQWIALVRKHAEIVVFDQTVFPVFKKHCKHVGPELAKKQKIHDCIPDEHYMQTLFSINNLENELEKRTLTYTSWNESKNRMDRKTWHPKTFMYADVSPAGINEIKSIDHVNYKMEYRTEWCQCNSTSVPCFLFARKFSKGAGLRIIYDGLVGPFDKASLLNSS